MIGLTIKGQKEATNRLLALSIIHRKNIRQAFYDYGNDIVEELRKVIDTGTRTGRIYFIRGKAHQASAPGEPPKTLSGRLADSFGYKARLIELVVYSTAFSDRGFNYPRFLEEKLNRPFWEVTHKQNAYKLDRDLKRL